MNRKKVKSGGFRSQWDVEEEDVLVVAVLHEEALGDSAQAGETQALVEVQGVDVCCHDGVELEDAEAEPGPHDQRVLDELLADVLPASGRANGIAGVADVAAAAHVVGVQDVEADDFARLAVDGDSGIGLAAEEVVGRRPGQLVELRERYALAHDLVPDVHGLCGIGRLIFPDRDHVVNPLAGCGLLLFVQIIMHVDGAGNAIESKGRD